MPPLRFPGLSPIRLVRLVVLACVAVGTLAGCALVKPGCSPGDSLPRQGDVFLALVLAADQRGGTILIDRAGRSHFGPEHTLSFWRTPAVCRTLSAEDLAILDEAWSDPALSSGAPASTQRARPLLVVAYYTADVRRDFFIKPTSLGESPTLENAVAVTLSVVGRTYGDRFYRELRAAGLQDLLRKPG